MLTISTEKQPVFIEALDQLPPEKFLEYFWNKKETVSRLPKFKAKSTDIAQKAVNNEFTLCGQTYRLPPNFSWKINPSPDKEWQIAHHKFTFAISLIQAYRHTQDVVYLRKWIELIDSWLKEMSSGFITASDGQVEARRIEKWLYCFLLLKQTPCQGLITPDFLRRFLSRIATETLYICEHLSEALNHRTLQLSTIFLVAVVFPEFRLHPYFLQIGRDKLTENFLSEFYPDGVHIELSTHYHQLSLKCFMSFVELAQAHKVELDPKLWSRLSQALDFYLYVQFPNGQIPLINDADDGDVRSLFKRGNSLLNNPHWLWGGTLGEAGEPPQELSKHFEDAGYFVFTDTWGVDAITAQQRQHVFYDCGQLGAGKHGHFDLFNFCYFAQGKPLIIDPGRYSYDAVPGKDGINWRREFKSTAYHNTVEIDGKDQTRYIPKSESSKFKLGSPVEILDKLFKLGQYSDWVCAKAKSYEYTPVHERFFLYMQRQYLFIFDRIHINDNEPHQCILRFHLPPNMHEKVSLHSQREQIRATAPDLTLLSYRCPGTVADIESGWASKKYGIKHPAPVVAISQTNAQSLFFCTIVAPRHPSLEIQSLELLNKPTDSMLLFQVTGQAESQSFIDRFCVSRDGGSGLFPEFGLNFTGLGLGFRQNADGQVIYLLSQQAKHIEINQ